MALHLLSVVLVLFVTGKSTEDACTPMELQDIEDCIKEHGAPILVALQGSATCDHTRIISPACQLFNETVTCITSSSIKQTCMHNAPDKINPHLRRCIPCTVGDFFHVCSDVHNPWDTGISTTTIPPKTINLTAPRGCGRKSVTQYLWVTLLMTTFLAMTITSADEF